MKRLSRVAALALAASAVLAVAPQGVPPVPLAVSRAGTSLWSKATPEERAFVERTAQARAGAAPRRYAELQALARAGFPGAAADKVNRVAFLTLWKELDHRRSELALKARVVVATPTPSSVKLRAGARKSTGAAVRLDDKDLQAQDKLGNFEIQQLMSDYNQAETLAQQIASKQATAAAGIRSNLR